MKTVAGSVAQLMRDKQLSFADTLCSLFHIYARQIGHAFRKFNNRAARVNISNISDIVLAGKAANSGLLQQLICKETNLQQIQTSEAFDVKPDQLQLANTCLLGVMHIDQLPANVPATTGGEFPRLLGRLTPGRPSNYRRLLIEMADYRPPAMKLRRGGLRNCPEITSRFEIHPLLGRHYSAVKTLSVWKADSETLAKIRILFRDCS